MPAGQRVNLMGLAEMFRFIVALSFAGVIMTGLILLSKVVFRGAMPVRWHYLIWMLLLLRLILPITPGASLSVYNYLPVAPGFVIEEHGSFTPSHGVDSTYDVGDAGMGSEERRHEPIEMTGREDLAATDLVRGAFSGSFLALLWVIGVCVGLGLMIAGFVRLHKKMLRMKCSQDPRLRRVVIESKRKLNMKTDVHVLESDSAEVPYVFGLFRPRLVISRRTVDLLSERQLQYVVMHELAHIKHNDVLVFWLTSLLQAIHWFNPVLWYAFSRMRNDAEVACDAHVLMHLSKAEYKAYGHTIISLMQDSPWQPRMAGTTGLAHDGSGLKRRITMISNFRLPTVGMTLTAVGLLVLVGCVGLTAPVDHGAEEDSAVSSQEAVEQSTAEEGESEGGLVSGRDEPGESPDDDLEQEVESWQYELFVNEQVIPSDGRLSVDSGDLEIGLRERVPTDYAEDPDKYAENRLENAADHVELISKDKLYKESAGAGTVVDIPIVYFFVDLSEGSTVHLEISGDLQDRLGLNTREVEVMVD